MKTASQKKPGKIETRLSMAVMVILVIVGAGLMVRQNQINPAVIALRPESYQQVIPPEPDRSVLIDALDSGIVTFSSLESFGPESLYEKINGRADLYLTSGFVSLNTQRFTMNEDTDNWVEVFVYDMGTPPNAFSVFSMQRREGAQAVDIVPHAYHTQNALFLSHGKYYMEIIGTDASPVLKQAMGILAGNFVKMKGATNASHIPGSDLFPEAGLEPDSLQLIAANAFGYEQLDRIYTCEYNIDGTRLSAFVSKREDSEAASALVSEYRQTLISYGATVVDASWAADDAAVMQFFDTYEIVFSRGRYLAGIHEAGNLETAEMVARRLAGHLELSVGK